MSDQDCCRASANVPVPDEPADDRNLYCVLTDGHDGAHYDDGAEVHWQHLRSLPQSALGGLHPELRARITAARAALGSFDAERTEALEGPPVDYYSWARRFQAELRGLVETIEGLGK